MRAPGLALRFAWWIRLHDVDLAADAEATHSERYANQPVPEPCSGHSLLSLSSQCHGFHDGIDHAQQGPPADACAPLKSVLPENFGLTFPTLNQFKPSKTHGTTAASY